MKDLPPLEGLSSEEKDALIRELWQALQALRVETETRKRKGVKKTSHNSSLPPAKGIKPNSEGPKPNQSQRTAIVGRTGGGRELSVSPDQVVVAQVSRCPPCGTEVDPTQQQLKAVYERLELPQVRPQVTRVERYGGDCPCCQQGYEAPVPVGLEAGSPFGQSIASVVTYLRYHHAVSYQRLSQLMAELYGVTISVGAIANLLQRVQRQLAAPVARIVERLRSARLVCSDETSARLNGRNQWEWVFQNEQVCLHVIRPSRGKA